MWLSMRSSSRCATCIFISSTFCSCSERSALIRSTCHQHTLSTVAFRAQEHNIRKNHILKKAYRRRGKKFIQMQVLLLIIITFSTYFYWKNRLNIFNSQYGDSVSDGTCLFSFLISWTLFCSKGVLATSATSSSCERVSGSLRLFDSQLPSTTSAIKALRSG